MQQNAHKVIEDGSTRLSQGKKEPDLIPYLFNASKLFQELNWTVSWNTRREKSSNENFIYNKDEERTKTDTLTNTKRDD